MFIVRYIAIVLGWLMNGIYEVLDKIGLPNIGVTIIFFTIIIYMLMTPIQVSQQKSSKLMSIITPEMQKIQKKYEGKKDQASQMKMQEELSALYAKYGYSPTGSCLPMLVQLPIFFGLYQVILYIPGYVNKVGAIFMPAAQKIASVAGYEEILINFVKENKVRLAIGNEVPIEKVIDFLYALKPEQWKSLGQVKEISAYSADLANTAAQSERINTFLTINITNSPLDAIVNSFESIKAGTASGKVILTIIIAVMIPFLAWFTQWLNLKLMPQAATQDNSSMNKQMQNMNTIMPLFSAFLCVSFNMGIGIYWIIGALVRCVQQVMINNKIAKVDPQQLAEDAKVKQEKKKEKQQGRNKDAITDGSITRYARANMKKIESTAATADEVSTEAPENYQEAPAGSIMAKANMVRQYDDKNRKKK